MTFRPLLAGLGLSLLATAAHAQTPDNTAPPVLNPAPVATPSAPGYTPAPAVARAPLSVPRRYPKSSLALVVGWGAPYGWGLEFSEMASANLDINVGAGLSVTGGKLGIGTRYYFTPERKVSGWVGANLVRSTGLDNIAITSNNNNSGYNGGYNSPTNSGVINYKAATLVHLRGGMRWQPVHRFAMFGGLGYGISLSGDAVEYVSGNFDQPTIDAIKLLAPGGVEVSVGVALGFN